MFCHRYWLRASKCKCRYSNLGKISGTSSSGRNYYSSIDPFNNCSDIFKYTNRDLKQLF